MTRNKYCDQVDWYYVQSYTNQVYVSPPISLAAKQERSTDHEDDHDPDTSVPIDVFLRRIRPIHQPETPFFVSTAPSVDPHLYLAGLSDRLQY